MELEASLPSYVLKLQIKPPQRVTNTKDGYLKRKYREEKRLDNIYDVKIRFRFLVFKNNNYSNSKIMCTIIFFKEYCVGQREQQE